jgi:hypothetical protein
MLAPALGLMLGLATAGGGALVKGRLSACTTLERAGIGGPYYGIAGSPAAGDTPMAVALLGAAHAAVPNDTSTMRTAAGGD